jgi:hypothetical protein
LGPMTASANSTKTSINPAIIINVCIIIRSII